MNSLLDFSQNQPAQYDDVPWTVDLIPCLQSVVKFGSVGDTARNIEIFKDYDSPEILVLGNRNKTIQLF